MEQILEKRTVTAEGCPFTCPLYTTAARSSMRRGCCRRPTTCSPRAINISIGVSDPGLGSAFGVTMSDGPAEVDARAAEFRRIVQPYL